VLLSCKCWWIWLYCTVLTEEANVRYLDRIAEHLPKTISISLPPIIDSGIFKRLIRSMKGRSQANQLARAGISTAQACNFIADSLIRRVAHYVPIMAIKDIPELFSSCEPLLYNHLLPIRLLTAGEAQNIGPDITPAELLAAIVGLKLEQISENRVITSFGLDSLGGM
jgi:hypothetical protein